MKIDDIYNTTNCTHMKACRTWVAKKLATIAKQVVFGLDGEYKQKKVQFVILF